MPSISIGSDPSNDIVIGELVIDLFHMQLVRENNQLKLVHPHPQATVRLTVYGTKAIISRAQSNLNILCRRVIPFMLRMSMERLSR